jgi:hypothetical protein
VPVTVALNSFICPTITLAVGGVTDTVMAWGGVPLVLAQEIKNGTETRQAIKKRVRRMRNLVERRAFQGSTTVLRIANGYQP